MDVERGRGSSSLWYSLCNRGGELDPAYGPGPYLPHIPSWPTLTGGLSIMMPGDGRWDDSHLLFKVQSYSRVLKAAPFEDLLPEPIIWLVLGMHLQRGSLGPLTSWLTVLLKGGNVPKTRAFSSQSKQIAFNVLPPVEYKLLPPAPLAALENLENSPVLPFPADCWYFGCSGLSSHPDNQLLVGRGVEPGSRKIWKQLQVS